MTDEKSKLKAEIFADAKARDYFLDTAVDIVVQPNPLKEYWDALDAYYRSMTDDDAYDDWREKTR